MEEADEKALKSKSTLKSIRAACDEKKNSLLREAVMASVAAPVATLRTRFATLSLHDVSFVPLDTKDDEAAVLELGQKILEVH